MKLQDPASFSARYETDPELTRIAFNRISNRQSIVLAVSGRLGAGKDSVAPPIMEGLFASDPFHELFAKPLKDEVDQVIQTIGKYGTPQQCVSQVVSDLSVPGDQAVMIVRRLWEDVRSGKVNSSRMRTDSTRFALQFWGTEVRRNQDVDYWVKLAVESTIEKVAGGQSIFVTDARFENEIDALTALGGHTVRLKISPEVQAQRIFDRDGIVLTPEARDHISETALDDYEAAGKFTIVVDTDHLSIDEVVLAALEGIRAAEGARV